MQFLSKLGLKQAGAGAGAGTASRLAALAPNVVAVLLVVALAAQLASFVWQVLAPPARPSAKPSFTAIGSSGPDVTQIVRAHLFGTAVVQGEDAAHAPSTNLHLVLAGTMAGTDPEKGWAIVGESAQAAKVYPTGASLPGGSKLKEVYPDRVILDRDGRLESLSLPRLSGGAAAPIGMAPGARQRNLADTVRTLVQQDPGAVSEIIRPQPVFAGGQQKGYRVYPGRDRARFTSLGLMPGDLVTAVNGTPLNDPNSGLEALRNVGAGSSVTLTVERNGAEQQITVDPSAVMPETPARGIMQPRPQSRPDDEEPQ